MSNPGPEPAAQWQQPLPQAVTGSPLPAPGPDAEPPMWTQAADGSELAVASVPPPAAAVPAGRGARVADAVFGRAPTMVKVVFGVVSWLAVIAYFLVGGTPRWVFAAAIVGVGASLIDVVRWYLSRK